MVISWKFAVGQFLLLGLCAVSRPAIGQTTATIDIDTTSTIPIAPGFSGVSDDLGFPVEYWDYRFNTLAAQVGYGWVRFPGGNTSDIYNWQTGQQMADWLAQFGANAPNGAQTSIASVAGRGGAKLIDAANRADLFGATFIVVANGFTDTPQSIGQLAAYVKANNIRVAAWELSNVPYLYPEFFADATTYLNKMKPVSRCDQGRGSEMRSSRSSFAIRAIPARRTRGTWRSQHIRTSIGTPYRFITIRRRAPAISHSGWRTRTRCW